MQVAQLHAARSGPRPAQEAGDFLGTMATHVNHRVQMQHDDPFMAADLDILQAEDVSQKPPLVRASGKHRMHQIDLKHSRPSCPAPPAFAGRTQSFIEEV